MLTLTVKNYRCYRADNPATFDVGAGLSAVLGPNNAGKSVVTRLPYELRALFQTLGQAKPLMGLLAGSPLGIALQTPDPQEAFHTGNKRPIELTLRWSSEDLAEQPASITLSIERDNNVRLIEVTTPGHRSTNANTCDIRDGVLTMTSPFIVSFEGLQKDCRDLSQSVYIGAFRNALNVGEGQYYDIVVGQNFAKQWRQQKTGMARSGRDAAAIVTESIRSILTLSLWR